MKLRQLFEAKARKVVAIMPGGFHPFHPGHKSLYDWAVKTFGKSNVYVAATNDTATRPFPFEVKKKLAAMAGVPESNFIQVKSPFNNREYANLLDADTALVFVRSDKDKTEQPLPDQTKKNGDPGYLRSYTGKNLNTADEMGYMAYGPTINFDFSGMQIKSASELRATWPEMSDEDKLKAAKLMYGNGAKVAVELLNQALGDKEAPVGEDASSDEEDEFHRKLDKLVHKTFGHSSDEKKDKKVKEWVGPALKGGKYAFQIAKFFYNNKWAIGFLTVTWKTIDWIGDAIAFIKKYTDNPIVQGLMRYGLPAVAVAVALYGGKKLYDELVKVKNEKDLEKALREFDVDKRELAELEKIMADTVADMDSKKTNEILGFATRSPKRTTRTVKRRPPEEDSVQDRLKKRRAMKAAGNPDAFKSGAVKEKSPPGREKQVKALKKKFDDPGAPYAIAWAQHNKKKK